MKQKFYSKKQKAELEREKIAASRQKLLDAFEEFRKKEKAMTKITSKLPTQQQVKPVVIPDMTPVKSSNVESIGWCENKLFIQFVGSGCYCYSAVPKELFDELLKAESVGSFLNKFVKPKFKYERVSKI